MPRSRLSARHLGRLVTAAAAGDARAAAGRRGAPRPARPPVPGPPRGALRPRPGERAPAGCAQGGRAHVRRAPEPGRAGARPAAPEADRPRSERARARSGAEPAGGRARTQARAERALFARRMLAYVRAELRGEL
jgi:hypothetical protein